MNLVSTKLTSPIYDTIEQYDTGWITCTDWTNQHLGTSVGGNVVHNLNTPLDDLYVQVLLSSDGTDANAIETRGFIFSSSAYGLEIHAVDNNNIVIQTGSSGIDYLQSDGTAALVGSGWYYRVIVVKKQNVVSVRNISEDFSTTEVDTGKNWIDGKRIYRKVWTGTTGSGTTSSAALGLTVDSLVYMIALIDSSSYGWIGQFADSSVTSCYFTNTTQNNVTIFHNAAHLQSRPYALVLEYTK